MHKCEGLNPELVIDFIQKSLRNGLHFGSIPLTSSMGRSVANPVDQVLRDIQLGSERLRRRYPTI
jgi:hypothetical protein